MLLAIEQSGLLCRECQRCFFRKSKFKMQEKIGEVLRESARVIQDDYGMEHIEWEEYESQKSILAGILYKCLDCDGSIAKIYIYSKEFIQPVRKEEVIGPSDNKIVKFRKRE